MTAPLHHYGRTSEQLQYAVAWPSIPHITCVTGTEEVPNGSPAIISGPDGSARASRSCSRVGE